MPAAVAKRSRLSDLFNWSAHFQVTYLERNPSQLRFLTDIKPLTNNRHAMRRVKILDKDARHFRIPVPICIAQKRYLTSSRLRQQNIAVLKTV